MNLSSDFGSFVQKIPIDSCEEQARRVIDGCNAYVHKILGVDLLLGLVILLAMVLKEFAPKDHKVFNIRALKTRGVLDVIIVASAVAISILSGLKLSIG